MSESCGRISKPISFSDKISMNMVGVVREYSIRAIQTIGDQLKKTDWSTMPYRIPFLVQISGKVQTASGTGVGNVLISYCHIDPVTGVNSIMPGYCPLITFTTNKFGEYAGEIRVSNKDWVNTAEHFNVTASLVDNNGITHTFSPAIQAVTVNHLVDAIISFTDNTTIAVVGTVTYDPLNVNNNVCPFEKLPLKLVDDADDKTTMTSDVEGAFSFSNTQGVGFTFTIDPYNGRTWRFRLISQGQTWTQGVQYSVTTNSDGSVDVKVNKVFAIADIRIDVFDTSLQTVNIGMFGGTGKAYLDLGSSTTFDIIPVDTRCLYKRTVDMSANFFENQIPAMNYQVVLTAAPNLPIVGTRNPTGLNPSGRFYCDPSKVPLTYFTEVGQLVQPLNIDVLNSSYIYRVEYIYFSGICFELLGSGTDKLAVTPATSQTDTQACYPIATKVFQEGETMKITVRLFEIYPTRNTGDNTAMNKTFAVENVTLSIEDQVGGFNSFIDYPYNTTLYRPFPTSEPIPYALDYSIIGGNPFPSSPFSYTFTVRVQRNGPDPEVYQLAISRTSNKWIIPVVGQVAKEVPNFYPVATDPTLIFMVIRDPPGGNSFTTWHSGTSIEFGMSLNSMQTFDGAASFELSGGAGVEAEADAGVAFGGFFATTVLSVSAGFGGRTMDVGSISTSRASDSHYQYSMSFSYDISTSTDPNIAGHASDVIIGGGVDLIVSEATEVYILSETATVRCLAKRDTFQWHPGHTTTFILPVIEIEDTVRNLGSLYDRTADTTVKSQLSKQIQNWATVLANYRDYNNNLTNVFTGDEALFNKMVQAYDQWNSKTLSTSEFLKAADSAMYPRKVISVNVGKVIKSILGMDPSQYGVNLKVNVPFNEKILDPAKMVPFNLVEPSLQDAAQQFDRRFTQSFRSTSSSCGNVLPQYQNDVMKGVCSDFAPGKWNNLFTAINSACNMPIDPGSTKSSLADIPLLNKVCQRRSAVKDASKIPGGVVESGTDSIFGFLKDPKKFVTFGATSPVTMSWTSSVTDTRAFTTELDTSRSRFMFDSSFGTDLTVSAANFQVFLENHAEQMQTIHIGKTSESSHSFERTVTVTLDDSDLGEYI